MPRTEKRDGLLLLALLGFLVWRYSGSESVPFGEAYSVIGGATGTTYATNAGIFFLTNQNHELGPGLWYRIEEDGTFVGPLGVETV